MERTHQLLSRAIDILESDFIDLELEEIALTRGKELPDAKGDPQ